MIDNLDEVLRLHAEWREGKQGGKQAELSRANLSQANLSQANLSQANLSRANLSRANLSQANLSQANLYGANLYGANLYGANLSRANLSQANLSQANLSQANLYGANLYGANLSQAKNILTAMADGWPIYALQWDNGIRIKAGCHWFTEDEARTHWRAMAGTDPHVHGKLMLAGVDALVLLAKAHGWPLQSKEAETEQSEAKKLRASTG